MSRSPEPWATMAGAAWNVLDNRGVRIACCNREDFKKDSDAEDEENAKLMAAAPTLERQLTEEIWRVNHLQQAIRHVITDDESRPGGWGPDVTMLQFLKQSLRESEEEMPCITY